MNNTALNCCDCGKELGLGTRVTTDGILWRCVECSNKRTSDNYKLRYELAGADETISQLKKQLKEKDDEISKWKSMAERSCNLLDRFSRTGELGITDQDKIEFAIVRLEKVKKLATDVWNESFGDLCLLEIKEIIDNEIKELRNGKQTLS